MSWTLIISSREACAAAESCAAHHSILTGAYRLQNRCETLLRALQTQGLWLCCNCAQGPPRVAWLPAALYNRGLGEAPSCDSLLLVAQSVCQQHWVACVEGGLVCRCGVRLLRALWCFSS